MRLKTIIETIFYLLIKKESADKIQLIKWIYLADKYHLINHGRTITGDSYYAMQYGPVGSAVKDVLELNERKLSPEERKYAAILIDTIDKISFKKRSNAPKIDFKELSETDKEALNFVVKKFGNMDSWKLKDYTHKYPEWKQHEQSLKTSRLREKIKTAELFSLISGDCIKVSLRQLKLSKEIFSGKA
ncbi:MAG: Panacea domain-containing protein [Elusimicrobia bacterium]|nr:Panacea domain-containing protein [Elusimicrobiota bacterium]